jgi:hypothetical protein
MPVQREQLKFEKGENPKFRFSEAIVLVVKEYHDDCKGTRQHGVRVDLVV